MQDIVVWSNRAHSFVSPSTLLCLCAGHQQRYDLSSHNQLLHSQSHSSESVPASRKIIVHEGKRPCEAHVTSAICNPLLHWPLDWPPAGVDSLKRHYPPSASLVKLHILTSIPHRWLVYAYPCPTPLKVLLSQRSLLDLNHFSYKARDSSKASP